MKQIIKKLAIVLSVALVCAPMGAMAVDKLIVKDVSGAINKFVVTDTSQVLKIKDPTGLVDKFIVTDLGKVGINTIPAFQFHLVGNGLDNGSAVGIFHNPGLPAANYTNADAPGFHFFRNNHSSLNSGWPKKDDVLGNLGFGSNINGYKWLALISAKAESDAKSFSGPAYLSFATAAPAQLASSEKMRLTSTGSLGIGSTAPTSKLHVVGILEYADNAAAIAAGLTAGAIYRTVDVLKIVH